MLKLMQFIQSQNYSDFVVSLFAVKAKHHDQPPISSLKTQYIVRLAIKYWIEGYKTFFMLNSTENEN